MKKAVIFNVGGALSSYITIDGINFIIDLGKGQDFSPVENFLIPLSGKVNNFKIEQLFISHPHRDHCNDIIEYDKVTSLYPNLLTTPNDTKKEGWKDTHKDTINRDLLTTPIDENVLYLLDEMCANSLRTPPLKVSPVLEEYVTLHHIRPGDIEKEKELNKDYVNNLSLCITIEADNTRLYFPGDIKPEGQEDLINHGGEKLVPLLKRGIDFLICPHHGLKSGFSPYFYQVIKDNKVQRLHVIPEKPNTDDNRVIHPNYYSKDYCKGENNLDDQVSIKTSTGHILIDFEGENNIVKKFSNENIDDLINEFVE